MLAAGDIDTFESILEWHLKLLPFARARSQVYFGWDSAFYAETKAIFGAYPPSDYGCSRPAGYPLWKVRNNFVVAME